MSYNDFADRIRDRLGIEIDRELELKDYWTKHMCFSPSTGNSHDLLYALWDRQDRQWKRYLYKDFEDRIRDRLGKD